MKGTITKLVSISCDGPGGKERAIEQFHLFGSTEGTEIRNVKDILQGFFKVGGIFKKSNKK